LQGTIEHCKLSHGEETLKYRQLVLDENTGIQRYQTKIHEGVVPSNLRFITLLVYSACYVAFF
jgi:hypothetical protein